MAFLSYLEEHILVRVDTQVGAYCFLQKALTVWHARHGGLIDIDFQKAQGETHAGTSWSVFNPELSSAALDDLTLVFECFFAPGPVLWEYVPAFFGPAR